MKLTCLLFVARRNFLVGPRTMGDGPLEQVKIVKLVSQNGLEEVEIGNRFGVLQNALNYKQTPEACLKRRASGVGMENRLLLLVAWSVSFSTSGFRCWSRCTCGTVTDALAIRRTNTLSIGGAKTRAISGTNAIARSGTNARAGA